ncbi:MAG: PAS domain S-box protein [Planctomycetota bacterium]
MTVGVATGQTNAGQASTAASGARDSQSPSPLLKGYDQTVIDRDDGLPSLTVRSLALDGDGALWLGTFAGLCRFDGTAIRTYPSRSTEGLESDRIATLHLDARGDLWIGTELGPVSRHRGGRFEVFAPADELSSVAVILETDDGTIWLCGDRLGRWRDGQLDLFDPWNMPQRTNVRAIHELEDGDLMIASRSGVFRFDPDLRSAEEFEPVPIDVAWNPRIAGFIEDGEGHLWVTGDSIVPMRITGAPKSIDCGPLGRLYSRVTLPDGRELLSMNQGLVYAVAGADGGLADLVLVDTDEDITQIVQTADGTLWIGAETSGLLRLSPLQHEFVDTGMPGSVMMAIVVPREGTDEVIAQTVVPKLVDMTRGTQERSRSRPLVGDRARIGSLQHGIADLDGRYWLASSTGVHRLEGDRVVEVPGLKGYAHLVVLADDGGLWAAMGSQFHEILRNEGRFGRAIAGLPLPPRSAATVPGGFACIAADRVVGVDVAAGSTEDLLVVPGVELRALAAEPDGTLWVTSYGDGLFRLRPDGTVDQWGKREGLPDAFLGWVGRPIATEVEDVTSRPDLLWMNSNSGAISVDVASLDRVAEGVDDALDVRLVRMSEGNGVSAAALDDGRLVLPTIHGLAVLEPRRISRSQVDPHVVIDDIRVGGETFDPAHPPRGVVDLEITYTAIHLTGARELAFQYRMDGEDDAWMDAGERRLVRYTNLSPGSYTFRVRARASGGSWSNTPATVRLDVCPRWFQRGAVQLVGLVGLVVLTALGLRLRTQSIVRRSRDLEREIERRHRVETELRASRAEHLSVLEAAQSGIVVAGVTGVVSYTNPSMADLFGLPREEIVGASLDRLRIAGFRKAVDAVLEARDGESPDDWAVVETSAERASGVHFDVELSMSRQEREGEPYAVCLVRDVSERNRMTNRLQRSEERYRTLFHTAPAAIVVWGPDMNIADWNERAEVLFGWERDDAIGEDFTVLFSLDSVRDPLRMAATRVLTETSTQTLVYSTPTLDGDARLCQWTFTPLVNPDRSLRAVISMVNDITEEHQVARDLDNLRRRLARAEETERSRIARELHDDLSQRLAALALEMQITLDDLDRLQHNDVRTALGGIQSGLQIVSTDVHALSRQLHPTVLDDLGLSRALRSECTRRHRATDSSISFLDETSGAAVSDDVALALFRIAQESIQNATKHAGASEIVVRLSERGGRVILEVQDDGVGFDPSEQGTDGSGGLGLASMRERARLVQADISIRTGEEAGTTVTVVADAVPPGGVETRSSAAPESRDSAESARTTRS